jgi:hypothetical protein
MECIREILATDLDHVEIADDAEISLWEVRFQRLRKCKKSEALLATVTGAELKAEATERKELHHELPR